MEIPERFRGYGCRDYFDSDRFTRGHYDEYAQFWTFYAASEIQEHAELEFLAVGAPGCDGLEWGYRKGLPGLWVFYPLEKRFQFLAPTLAEFFDGWYSERIIV